MEIDNMKELQFIPSFDRVLIKPISHLNEKTEGGILLPDNRDKGRAFKGVVVKVGPGRMNDDNSRVAMWFKEGDVVYYNKYGGTFVQLGDIEFSCMKEDDIYGKVVEVEHT